MNRTSVGMRRLAFVRANTFSEAFDRPMGRFKVAKNRIAKKRTFKPLAVSAGSGFGGGRVRTAVLMVR